MPPSTAISPTVRRCSRPALSLAFAILLCNTTQAAPPLRAHPQNPYIFEFRGEPTLLRTYGEHYGSVINPAFDYTRYLDVLERDGMNLTRAVLMGIRSPEKPGQDPLTPSAADFLQPWARTTAQGNALDGQGKWDFTKWNESYFTRLRNFAQACSDRGIVAEMYFFNTLYFNSPEFWSFSPFNPANNVQGYGPASQFDTVRGTDPNLTAVQEAAVRRIVRELNAFDNIYYEIQNEPFWNEPDFKDNEEVAFHNTMLAIVRNEESLLQNQHMVAHNFPDQLSTISTDFDIINCHYPFNVLRGSDSPIVGGENLLAAEYTREKILSLDETSAYSGLSGRLESWMFLHGGGGVFNGLDSGVFDPNAPLVYSTQNETGDVEPGISIRKAIRDLGTYTDNLHLTALRRNSSWITGGVPSGARIQGMASADQQYVAYLHHGAIPPGNYQTVYNPIGTSNVTANLQVTLPAGNWRVVWTKPADLTTLKVQTINHPGGAITLEPVTYQSDVALRIDRSDAGDTTPPPIPKSLSAEPPWNGAVDLSWTPVQAADLVSYHLYHSTAPGVTPVLANRIAVIPSGQSTFSHGPVAMNQAHHYVLTSVDSWGNESAVSREVVSFVQSQPSGPSPHPVPGIIQCEAFDLGGKGVAYNDSSAGNQGGDLRLLEDVDIAASNDTGGGHHVSQAAAGEWLHFTIHVAKTDTYNLDIRCLTPTPGSGVRLFSGSNPLTEIIPLPASGSWQTVQVANLRLSEGDMVLRFEIINAASPGDAGSFNWISLTPASRPGPNAQAGLDQEVPDSDWNLTESVTLKASSSLAGTQPISSYAWMENGVVIATGIQPTINLAAGSHRIQLVTTDSAGLTDTDDLDVTIQSPGFVNGGFENGFAGWSVLGSSVVLGGYAATEGTKVLVFNDANTTPNGAVSQSFPTVPGQTYRVRFDMGVLAGNLSEQRLQLDITGNGTLFSKSYSANGTGGGSLVWSAKNESFTANSDNTRIIFRDQSTTSAVIDLMLDNVRITRVLANGILPDPLAISKLPAAWKVRIVSPDVGLYQLMRSTNLASWTIIEQRQVNAPGIIEFTDAAASPERGFYRVGLVQPP